MENNSVPTGWRVLYGSNGNHMGYIDENSTFRASLSISVSTLDERFARLEAASTTNAGVPTGSMMPFAGRNAPRGWLLCDGSAQSRIQFNGLFGVIETLYGTGDGINTFNLPDLRGRTTIGTGQGTGLSSRVMATQIGQELHTLTINEMPNHSHGQYFTGGNHDRGRWTGCGVHGRLDVLTDGQQTTTTGGGQPHNNMQPSLVVNYIIKC